MATVESEITPLLQRPKRADARRNYDKLVAAARDAFAEHGTSASLEEVARRAGVGIGTLYRRFPSRQDLLEAVYVEELADVCQSADELTDLPPWEALSAWLHRLVEYVGRKHALAEELWNYLDRDAVFFSGCRTALFVAGEPLLARAQAAHEVREDVDYNDVIQMVGGIGKNPATPPEQVARILDIALDGLRYRPAR
ncbi:MAG TPA: helix-turn-helix domain-containing protein [Solirubrobacteraceae bacterium]|jgi:AcrR family transcriptional regulator|nr:helix-turn-helix domain-containing protein [Solirubrobacteraceae bacterium]